MVIWNSRLKSRRNPEQHDSVNFFIYSNFNKVSTLTICKILNNLIPGRSKDSKKFVGQVNFSPTGKIGGRQKKTFGKKVAQKEEVKRWWKVRFSPINLVQNLDEIS